MDIEGELIFNTFTPSTGIVVSGGTFNGNINRIQMGTRALEASSGIVKLTFAEITVSQPGAERIIINLSGNVIAQINGYAILGGIDYNRYCGFGYSFR